MEKVDELYSPPIIGEKYLVPCIITLPIYPDDEEWLDNEDNVTKKLRFLYPIINHKHSDRENGQSYEHYHVDYRFLDNTHIKGWTRKNKKYILAPNIRFNLLDEHSSFGWNKSPRIEYFIMECYSQSNTGISGRVNKAKLKHKCIYKGKCPHRGYSLNQEIAENGIITCPLHGLQFDATTKKLIS